MRALKLLIVGSAGLALTGCVAAVPVAAPTYTVIPGQSKTEADLRADDAICRRPVLVSTSTAPVTGATQAAQVTAEQYYGCMASRGEAVIQQQAYPVSVPYAYPAYAAYPYGYGYPYGGGYPYFGYPYGGYFGPYVGFGIGFGYGRFYGGHFGNGYYGGRGFGGGGFRGGGFHR